MLNGIDAIKYYAQAWQSIYVATLAMVMTLLDGKALHYALRWLEAPAVRSSFASMRGQNKRAKSA